MRWTEMLWSRGLQGLLVQGTQNQIDETLHNLELLRAWSQVSRCAEVQGAPRHPGALCAFWPR